MRGFFQKVDTSIPYKSEKGMHSCASCGLYKTSSNPRMAPYGEFKKKIMFIGEFVSKHDDEVGEIWSDDAGDLLKKSCKKLGVDLYKDCITINAVGCAPNGPLNLHQIACCRQKVLGAIKRLKPTVVILFGEIAVSSVIGYKWTQNFGSLEKWRGWTIPDRDYNAWLCPMDTPSSVLNAKEGEVQVIWERQLKVAFNKRNDKFPYNEDERNLITVSDDVEGVLLSLLREKPTLMAFDIETTGLKPYDKGHEIVAISFCTEEHKAYSIPFPTTAKGLVLLRKLLEHPKIGKIAANMSYEDNWMTTLHDIKVSPWVFDTMQAAHVLDNRPGITGLKFQGYVRLGQLGYADSITPYFTSPDSNALNNIKELQQDPKGFHDLLVYCGIDSLLEFRLATMQMKELGINEI